MFEKLKTVIFGATSQEKEVIYSEYTDYGNNPSLKGKSFDELLVISEDWNGYAREKAVKKLGDLGNPLAIPKLIVRVNDWVPQVRKTAKESLLLLLTAENAKAFVINLPDLYHLKNCKRGSYEELIEKIISFLIEPNNNQFIKSAIKDENPYLARIAVSLCIEYSLLSEREIVLECLQHSDVIVRNKASHLLANFSGKELEGYLKIAIKDSYMPIRREALQIYLRVFPKKGLSLAERYIFDKHNSIREISVNYLQKQKKDVQNILKETLLATKQTAPKIRCAISGLAYIGVNNLEKLVSVYADHSFPSVRKVSLQALSKLPNENSKAYLLKGLEDSSPSVAKESSRLFISQKIDISISELSDILKRINFKHTLPVCLSVSRRLTKWKKLIFLLSTCHALFGKNEITDKLLNDGLLKWDMAFNRNGSPPLESEVKEIRDIYSLTKPLFTKERKLLEFTLRGCGIIKK